MCLLACLALGSFNLQMSPLSQHCAHVMQSRWFPLVSTRKKSKISGEIKLDLAIVDSKHNPASPELITAKLRGIPSMPSTPANELDGFDVHSAVVSEDDDEEDLSSDELNVIDEDGTKSNKSKGRKMKDKAKRKIRKGSKNAYEFAGGGDVVGVIFLEIGSISDLPPEKNSQSSDLDLEHVETDDE